MSNDGVDALNAILNAIVPPLWCVLMFCCGIFLMRDCTGAWTLFTGYLAFWAGIRVKFSFGRSNRGGA